MNKKLSRNQIEELIFTIIKETNESGLAIRGKNMYITNTGRNIRLTVNSFTNRIITVDRFR